jgi:peroxidase
LDIRGDFPYPIIADETRELAVKLDMIDEDNKDNEAEAMTVRALYIIGPDHKLKLSMHYPTSTGRNVE